MEGNQRGWRGTDKLQTTAEFVTAAHFKRASLVFGDTAILHPTAGDTMNSSVLSCQVTKSAAISSMFIAITDPKTGQQKENAPEASWNNI